MTDKPANDNWLHYSEVQLKRKRAQLTCVACHSKKVKCDLQLRKNDRKENCSRCASSGRDCQARPSKREKRKKLNEEDTCTKSVQGDSETSNEVDALPNANATLQASTEANLQTGLPDVGVGPHQNYTSLGSLQETRTRNLQPIVSDHTISPVVQRRPPNVTQTRTRPTNNGNVDSESSQACVPENQFDADNQAFVAQLEHRYPSKLRPDLEQIFTETYYTYSYPWCPVLDPDTLSSEVAKSPLLANALALVGSHIQPPLLPHDGPETYYKRARAIFYNDEEADEMISLKALCLFYWWEPQTQSRVHRHGSWWWTSVIIRHAQQMNIHREPAINDPSKSRVNFGLRRRIWWTAFARERLASLFQSKPVIIDPDDCNIQQPTLADFPDDAQSQHQGEIFIQWVRLSAIIGRIAKVLLKSSEKSVPLPDQLREELITWVHQIPPRLRLHIDTSRTESFDRDVHQLHLFYLTTIIILHLKCSGGHLTQALPPAILAASCTARILRDILVRGNSQFLMAITCWHVGAAFIALLQARRICHLSKFANEDLDVLIIAAKELQKMWASANVIVQGFDRLRKPNTLSNHSNAGTQLDGIVLNNTTDVSSHSFATNGTTADKDDNFDWMRFFPFVSKSTNDIAESLITGREQGKTTRGFPSPSNELFHDTLLAQYQNLFDPLT